MVAIFRKYQCAGQGVKKFTRYRLCQRLRTVVSGRSTELKNKRPG